MHRNASSQRTWFWTTRKILRTNYYLLLLISTLKYLVATYFCIIYALFKSFSGKKIISHSTNFRLKKHNFSEESYLIFFITKLCRLGFKLSLTIYKTLKKYLKLLKNNNLDNLIKTEKKKKFIKHFEARNTKILPLWQFFWVNCFPKWFFTPAQKGSHINRSPSFETVVRCNHFVYLIAFKLLFIFLQYPEMFYNNWGRLFRPRSWSLFRGHSCNINESIAMLNF